MIVITLLVLTTVGRAQSVQIPAPDTAVNNITSNNSAPASVLQPDWMAHFYVFGLGLGLGVGGAVSWKYVQTWTGEFVTTNEGWFSKDTYAGGADKLGHFYTDFILMRGLHEIYVRHGYGEGAAILNALLGTATIRTVMEVADGYTTFKFSPQDLASNLLGAISSAVLLAHPKIDEIISVSWTYLPSREKLDGKVDWVSVDNDYNGSVYHLDIRLKGLFAALADAPTRVFDPYSVDLSYYTRGYDRQRETKHRMLGLNLSINLEEVIASHADPAGTTYQMKAFFRYFKVPFTFGGLVYDVDHKKLGFRYGLNFFY
jgi:hypothetical protein